MPSWPECVCGCGEPAAVATRTRKTRNQFAGGPMKVASGHRRKGETHVQWKGGRYYNDAGYVMVTLPSDHEFISMAQWISGSWKTREHRLVMAQHLGRPLRSEESVHHINGIRDDNRLENLELWSGSHPPGKRVDDLVAWAKEILSLYGGNS